MPYCPTNWWCSDRPKSTLTFRGGGLPDEHRGFFAVGTKFRQAGFLATSFSKEKAEEFAYRANAVAGLPAVLWKVQVDVCGESSFRHRCKHVNLVGRTNVPGEQEYLFVLFSVFTVAAVAWSANPSYVDPHVITLDAATDNLLEPEDLPSAPWG